MTSPASDTQHDLSLQDPPAPEAPVHNEEPLGFRAGPHRRRRRRNRRSLHLLLPPSAGHHQDQAPDQRRLRDLRKRPRRRPQDVPGQGNPGLLQRHLRRHRRLHRLLRRLIRHLRAREVGPVQNTELPSAADPSHGGGDGQYRLFGHHGAQGAHHAADAGRGQRPVLASAPVILENDGVLGLYAGYSATLLRNLPAGVLSYSSFEYLKTAVQSKTRQAQMEPIQSVICGALAGAISASVTTPLDVVKTRLMTQNVNAAAAAVVVSRGVSATVKQIIKEEGWVGFTRGMGPRVLHSACFSALRYFAFETARLAILNEYIKRKELHSIFVLFPSLYRLHVFCSNF